MKNMNLFNLEVVSKIEVLDRIEELGKEIDIEKFDFKNGKVYLLKESGYRGDKNYNGLCKKEDKVYLIDIEEGIVSEILKVEKSEKVDELEEGKKRVFGWEIF